MISNYRKLLELLSVREKKIAGLLVGLAIVMGALDVLGVASVLPFLAVVSNPEMIQQNPALARAYELAGEPGEQAFLKILGVGAFLFVLFAALFRSVTFYALTRFVRMRVPSLSARLMRRYLGQPYAWYLQRHTADLGKSILSEVNQVVNGPLQASVNLVAHAVILLFIVVFLFALQPLAAIGAAALFGGTYGLIFLAVKRPLTRMGRERLEANREKFQVMQEAMGGIKNVKLMNLEESYVDRLHVPAYRQARNQAAQAMISELPRNLLEVIAFGGMILFTLWLLVMQGGRIHNIIPILGVYAFAAARIFPNIQKVFASVSTIRFGQPALEQLHADLTGPPPDSFTRGATGPQIHLRDRLELDDVTFRFPGSETPALDGLTMTIRANTAVGIVGATGAGKTTTVDLILGLLSTQEGALRIDGQEIGPHNVRAWQKSVGYVPQDIFLIDDTVSANIAFGSPPGKIDHEAVRRAARMAALDEFVREQLPEGYDTRVGERGTRLSGGQRQRIGIARALYADPDMLVFDEATSALDTITERAVIDAVKTIGRTKTIIMIAHRLMTVRDCDEIFLLERGRLAAQGSYDDLVERHAGFRALHQGAA